MRRSVTTTCPPRSARRGAAERLAEQGVQRAGWGTPGPRWHARTTGMDRDLQLPEIALWLASSFGATPVAKQQAPHRARDSVRKCPGAGSPPTYAPPAPGILTHAAVGPAQRAGPVLVSGIVRARQLPGPKVMPRRGPWPPGGARPRLPRAGGRTARGAPGGSPSPGASGRRRCRAPPRGPPR